MEARYLNLFTDYGFKRVFGEAPNKPLLISFLHALLPDSVRIADLQYLKTDRLGERPEERTTIFDLYCVDPTGKRFMVELQRAKQLHFLDRTLYYATRVIQEQGRTGKQWQYELYPVYSINILDFKFSKADHLLHHVQLMDHAAKMPFSDKLHFYYLEVRKFDKPLAALETDLDRWLFAFKNLHKLNDRPAAYRDRVFERLFEIAEIARFTKKEMKMYQDSLKAFRDNEAIRAAYLEEGKLKGKLEGKLEGEMESKQEVVLRGLRMGMTVQVLHELTGISIEQIEEWKAGMNDQNN